MLPGRLAPLQILASSPFFGSLDWLQRPLTLRGPSLWATRRATYISIQAGRSVILFFRAVIKSFTGGYEHVGPVQIVMLGVSSAVVASVVAHTTQRWIIAFVLEIGLLAYLAPFKSANVIASDARSTCTLPIVHHLAVLVRSSPVIA
jgi:hypothetical protein